MSGWCVSGRHYRCPDNEGKDTYRCHCPCHMFSQAKARSPVGLESATCHPCGHSYGAHDDYGCLWYTCWCRQCGERK